jgi:hypothetical protein
MRAGLYVLLTLLLLLLLCSSAGLPLQLPQFLWQAVTNKDGAV